MWTFGEQKCFLEALEKYGHENSGKEWLKIAQHIGTRSIGEVREHAGKYFVQLQEVQLHKPVSKRPKVISPSKSTKPSEALWTTHENLVFEHSLAAFNEASNKRWTQIATLISSKTANDVRDRYQKLAHDLSRIETGNHVTLVFESPNTQVAWKYPILTSAEGNLLREALHDIQKDSSPSPCATESINTAITLISSCSQEKTCQAPSFSKHSARNAVQAALQSAESENPAVLDALESALKINT